MSRTENNESGIIGSCTVDEALQNLVRLRWLEQRAGKGVRVVQELPHRVVAFVSGEELRSWNSSLAEQLIMQGFNEVLTDAGYQTHVCGLHDVDDDKTVVSQMKGLSFEPSHLAQFWAMRVPI